MCVYVLTEATSSKSSSILCTTSLLSLYYTPVMTCGADEYFHLLLRIGLMAAIKLNLDSRDKISIAVC